MLIHQLPEYDDGLDEYLFPELHGLVADAGFDLHMTRVDRLMAEPGLGLAVAWAMECPDEPYPN